MTIEGERKTFRSGVASEEANMNNQEKTTNYSGGKKN
jgi:hypothetical protein